MVSAYLSHETTDKYVQILDIDFEIVVMVIVDNFVEVEKGTEGCVFNHICLWYLSEQLTNTKTKLWNINQMYTELKYENQADIVSNIQIFKYY